MTDTPDPSEPPEGAAQEAARPKEGPVGGYRVQLPTFEGPLDLLLHLIEEHELNILDIPIAFVAQKYVEYITLMEELNIDLASEYLVMAATLTHIKSKMLLPVPPEDQDDGSEEPELDPRAALVRRLLEYQKYKQAAEQLNGGPVFGRDVFGRGLPAPSVEGPAPLAGLSLFKLLDAFQAVLARAKKTVDHQIDFERFSITDRINELSDILRKKKVALFEELFDENASRADLIITFLALLEMTRLRLTRLIQAGPLEPITVELAVSEDDEAAFAEATGGGDDSFAPRAPKPEAELAESEAEETERSADSGEGDDSEDDDFDDSEEDEDSDDDFDDSDEDEDDEEDEDSDEDEEDSDEEELDAEGDATGEASEPGHAVDAESDGADAEPATAEDGVNAEGEEPEARSGAFPFGDVRGAEGEEHAAAQQLGGEHAEALLGEGVGGVAEDVEASSVPLEAATEDGPQEPQERTLEQALEASGEAFATSEAVEEKEFDPAPTFDTEAAEGEVRRVADEPEESASSPVSEEPSESPEGAEESNSDYEGESGAAPSATTSELSAGVAETGKEEPERE